MKYPSRTARMLIVGLAAVAVTTVTVRQLCSSELDDQETAKLVAQMIPQFHLSKPTIDDEASAQLLDAYIEDLDPQKLYFLKSDVEAFERYRTSLDDSLLKGNVDFAYQVFDVFARRVETQCEVAHRWIDAEHDFTLDEEMLADPDDREWASTPDELNERWRKWIKRELLQFRLDETELEEARENLHKRYRNIKLMRVDQNQDIDTLELYLTELAQVFDPHSSYMSPNTWEDFQIQFRLSLDGIGASLRADDGYTIVHEIVPGGAADEDGRLQPGDKILAVGQETGELVDIYEMKLSDVVRLIRGERGTTVRLRVKPADGGETKVYDLVRQKIELADQAVRGEIIDTEDRIGRKGRVGVIHVPSFYRDFDGAQTGGDFKSATADVAQVLESFRGEDIDAVVIDLRSNGGGALSEAIEMSGLFIDQGPVVQVKDERGRIHALNDEDPGVMYSGPLVVLCNRLSASASEIFAGVIKDYRRGLIVGDTTTHGKGTVQNLMDVSPGRLFQLVRGADRGKLKLTIQQFYRVNGDSTQNEGVRSDIVLPSLLDHGDLGEAFLDNALPFDHIDPAPYSQGRLVNPDLVAQLQQRSEQRVAADEEFQDLQDVISRYLERKNRKTISLNEAQARADREAEVRDAQSEALEEAEDSQDGADQDEVFPDNFYDKEVLSITLDYAAAARQLMAAARR
ncbi:MAG: tail-specific protease [Planctomycetota bacterium]|nr:MAG: tail-specific protease [Planctomycetota bacterium]REJ94177.1 MAG: tail-specific protease [Planctomycetota bacterium]REK21219.1 MAG: tail-specific protease [Planctomycetota bacterium]REK29629.1 MAG: tail-specific protease [Planctomycetota bacterium]